MYEAKVNTNFGPQIALGPTQTRDEASRLARAWLDAHAGVISAGLAPSRLGGGPRLVLSVSVLEVEEEVA